MARAPSGADRGSRTAVLLERTDVLRLRALLALGDVELHPLVLVQAAVAVCLDRRVVDEDVSAATVRGDEAEALFAVEPLHAALRHSLSPCQVSCPGSPP